MTTAFGKPRAGKMVWECCLSSPALEPQPHRRGSEWRGHAPTRVPGCRKELALWDRELPCRLTHSLAQG